MKDLLTIIVVDTSSIGYYSGACLSLADLDMQLVARSRAATVIRRHRLGHQQPRQQQHGDSGRGRWWSPSLALLYLANDGIVLMAVKSGDTFGMDETNAQPYSRHGYSYSGHGYCRQPAGQRRQPGTPAHDARRQAGSGHHGASFKVVRSNVVSIQCEPTVTATSILIEICDEHLLVIAQR